MHQKCNQNAIKYSYGSCAGSCGRRIIGVCGIGWCATSTIETRGTRTHNFTRKDNLHLRDRIIKVGAVDKRPAIDIASSSCYARPTYRVIQGSAEMESATNMDSSLRAFHIMFGLTVLLEYLSFNLT